jgi:hypothetical protein
VPHASSNPNIFLEPGDLRECENPIPVAVAGGISERGIGALADQEINRARLATVIAIQEQRRLPHQSSNAVLD